MKIIVKGSKEFKEGYCYGCNQDTNSCDVQTDKPICSDFLCGKLEETEGFECEVYTCTSMT